MNFWGEMLKFFRETPKKGREKMFRKNLPTPVSEVLDPLVPVLRFTAKSSGDNVTPKLNVGTGKTGYIRTRDHLTRIRPDP